MLNLIYYRGRRSHLRKEGLGAPRGPKGAPLGAPQRGPWRRGGSLNFQQWRAPQYRLLLIACVWGPRGPPCSPTRVLVCLRAHSLLTSGLEGPPLGGPPLTLRVLLPRLSLQHQQQQQQQQ